MIAALAALNSHESDQKDSGGDFEYEDFLVVYDLFAAPGQIEEFARVVKKMAMAVCNWKSVLYINREQMDEFAASLEISSKPAVFARVHELVGIEKADEIYLCRNWQFGNRLMLHAYRDAEKICYGDGIGLYFSEAYFLPELESNGRSLISLVKGRLRQVENSLRGMVRPVASPVVNPSSASQVLAEVDFDVGYFLLPDILGEKPPMKTRLVKKAFTDRIFQTLAAALDAETADRYRYISRVPTVILMTSNFSEASRMSSEKEIRAYREFLKRLNFPRESTLVVKPHPRDKEEKIEELGRALSHLFSDVVLLTDPDLVFVPFEIFLMQTFRGENAQALRDLKIVTFSTACLSLELLFALVPVVGFGSEIVSKFFYEDYISGRIRHERDLQLALQMLAQVA